MSILQNLAWDIAAALRERGHTADVDATNPHRLTLNGQPCHDIHFSRGGPHLTKADRGTVQVFPPGTYVYEGQGVTCLVGEPAAVAVVSPAFSVSSPEAFQEAVEAFQEAVEAIERMHLS